MNYRRVFIKNSYVFLTIVTSKRRKILIENIELFKIALQKSIENYNYKIFAICVLPDHFHMIIKPYDFKDYPKIIKQIKTYFSKNFDVTKLQDYSLSASNIQKRERDIWQRRYWEHTILSEQDLQKHTDYIHYNPFKHGYVKAVKDWEYSSFRKFVKYGFYVEIWCNFGDLNNILCLDFE